MVRGVNTINMEGRLALRAGKGLEDNPYKSNETAKWNAWNRGWNTANDIKACKAIYYVRPICANCIHYKSKCGAYGFCLKHQYGDQPDHVMNNGCDWPRISRAAVCSDFKLSPMRENENKIRC